MTVLAQNAAIGDNQLVIDSAFPDGSFPAYIKIDDEILTVGGQDNRTGKTLILSVPVAAVHTAGDTVIFAGRPWDTDFLSATGGGVGGGALPDPTPEGAVLIVTDDEWAAAPNTQLLILNDAEDNPIAQVKIEDAAGGQVTIQGNLDDATQLFHILMNDDGIDVGAFNTGTGNVSGRLVINDGAVTVTHGTFGVPTLLDLNPDNHTISFNGADPVTQPEIPATPDAQDIADVLVALGLATQAAP